jgi:medium-chain acyl-[acyl-carrier-protein] hydrolase
VILLDNIFSHEMTVNYSDVDESDSLSNVGFLRMFQEVGAMHCDTNGYGPNNTATTHVAWIILNWRLKVFFRPRWNTKLKINTWTKTCEHLFSYRDFEMYDDCNNLVAIATSKWILLNCVERHVTRLTDDVEIKYNCVDKSVFNDKVNEKLKEPIDSINVLDYTICRRDIDTNHHVNNLNYLTYAYEALPEKIYNNSIFNNVEIMYKHEAKLNDKLTFSYSCINNSEHIVCIKNMNENTTNAIVKLY